MKHASIFGAVVFCSLPVVPAFAGNCGADFVKFYVAETGHKAFATEGGDRPSGHVACGFAARYASKAGAVTEALRKCSLNARQYRPLRVCKIYRKE